MTSVYLQVLTQLESLGAEMTEKTVLNIMCAYETSGDSNSIREVFSRLNSTGSAASTVAVYNKVLSTYASSPDLTNWESIVNHCDQYYGPNHVLADATTYDSMMIACEKYGRADDGLGWFDESVRSSATNTVTKVQRESLLRMIGDDKYNEYMSKLSVEHQAKVMSVASSKLPTLSSLSSAVPVPVPVRVPKLQGSVKETSSSDAKVTLSKSKKTLAVTGSDVTTKKEKSKSEPKVSKAVVPISSSSKVLSDSAAGKVEVPISSSVKTDLESALKKVWVPSSSSSKVLPDSAAGKLVVHRLSSIGASKSPKTVSTSTTKMLLTPSSIKRRLLKTFALEGNNFYEVVEQITSELMAAHIEPTVDIMNAMILAHSFKGDVVATQRMIDEMKLAGLEPNPISISFLVSAYLRNSDKAGAERAWTEALTGGLKPGMTYLVLNM
jgi:hypothetical protein